MEKNIQDILNEGELIDLNEEFKKALKNFNNEINIDNFIGEIQKYMDNEIEFKEEIIQKLKELNDKDSK